MDAGEDHESRKLASFFSQSGEGIFDRGGEPIDYGLKIERKRIEIIGWLQAESSKLKGIL
jgi:hypothetical protein